MRTSLFLIFLLSSLIVYSQETIEIPDMKSYNESVFPSDINKFPLLFIMSATDANPDIKKDDRKKMETKLSNFIETQGNIGGYNHSVISEIQLEQYDKNIFKYVVYSTTLHSWQINAPAGTTPAQLSHISFYFFDRSTEKSYRTFGYSTQKKPSIYYDESTIAPYKKQEFFTHLNRILVNLNSFGPEETFKQELKTQIKSRRDQQIGYCLLLGLIVAGCAIGGQFLY